MRLFTAIYVASFITATCGTIGVSMQQQNRSTIQPINLTVKKGIYNDLTTVPVPDLIGLTLAEATKELKDRRLEIGAVVYPSEADSSRLQSLLIYKQNPTAKNEKAIQNFIRKGKFIDVWLESMISSPDSSKKVIRVVRSR